MRSEHFRFDEPLLGFVHFLSDHVGLESDGTSLGIALSDEPSGKFTFNLGTIQGDETSFLIRINYRYPVTFTYDDCAPICDAAFLNAGFLKVNETHKACLYLPEDCELVQTLLHVYADETGLSAIPKSIGGGTYAKAIPNVVAFGPIFPGDEVREHKPDEFMEIDRLMENVHIFCRSSLPAGQIGGGSMEKKTSIVLPEISDLTATWITAGRMNICCLPPVLDFSTALITLSQTLRAH